MHSSCLLLGWVMEHFQFCWMELASTVFFEQVPRRFTTSYMDNSISFRLLPPSCDSSISYRGLMYFAYSSKKLFNAFILVFCEKSTHLTLM